MVINELLNTLRRWRRRPFFPITALLLLATSLGVATTLFTVLVGVVYPRLPWPHAERLVVIHAVRPHLRDNPSFAKTWNRGALSWGTWRDLIATPQFEEVGVWIPSQQVFGAKSEPVSVFYTSSSFMAMLGLTPALGRVFTAEDDTVRSDKIVLSYRAWQTRFASDPNIVGEVIPLAANYAEAFQGKEVVGVLSSQFSFQGESPDFFMPIGVMSYVGSFDTTQLLRAIGRLAPTVSMSQALSAAEPLVRRTEAADRRAARVVSLSEDRYGPVTQPLWVILAGSALLVVIACSNVAGLILIESAIRKSETAIRVALGASYAVILRQLLVEHVLLSVLAAAGGMIVAFWLTPALVALGPTSLVGAELDTFDSRVVVFCIVLGTTTVLAAALGPSLGFMSPERRGDLRVTREATHKQFRSHRYLVAGQLAVALVLLVGASLFGGSIIALRSTPLGFTPDNLYVLRLQHTRAPSAPARYRDEVPGGTNVRDQMMQVLSQGWAETERMLDRIRAVPGIVAAAAANGLPFAQAPPSVRLRPSPDGEGINVPRFMVSRTFFESMGIPLLKGRDFSQADRLGPRVAIVSAELERTMLGGDAIGKQLALESLSYQVIGVVPNVKQHELSDVDLGVFYVLDVTAQASTLVVLRSGAASPSQAMIRSAIGDHDPTLVVGSSVPMRALIDLSLSDEKFRAVLVAGFGVASLLLATSSFFGVMSRLVSERRREIGIRMAVGAGPRHVRQLLAKDALVIIVIGCGVGVPLAVAASYWFRSLVFGVSPMSVPVLGISVVALSFAAVAATAHAALRAGRIDPVLVLRSE